MALGECSNEFVVREGSIKSARFVHGRERREAERERECGRSRRKKESPWLGRKNGRANGNAPHQAGVTTGDGKMRRMKELASLGARRERDVTEPSHSFQKCVLEERTVLWK